MITEDKRIRIIAGHYGSGKTEFAVNYAVALGRLKRKVALADLDILDKSLDEDKYVLDNREKRGIRGYGYRGYIILIDSK